MSSTQPGSRAHRLVQLVDALVESEDRGVTVGEIREAYQGREGEPAPDSLTSEISSLKRRGVLAIVGGRPGHSLYAPADRELDLHQRQDDDGIIVLGALKGGAAFPWWGRLVAAKWPRRRSYAASAVLAGQSVSDVRTLHWRGLPCYRLPHCRISHVP